MSDPAAIAAFVAAGLSLVNVAITARLASQGQREEWRRTEERPIVARILSLSHEITNKLFDAGTARKYADADPNKHRPELWWESPHADDVTQPNLDMIYQLAQLDLLASKHVRKAASDLFEAHEKEITMVLVARWGPDEDERSRAAHERIRKLEEAVIDAARADLGLGSAKRPSSLLGMLLGAINGQ